MPRPRARLRAQRAADRRRRTRAIRLHRGHAADPQPGARRPRLARIDDQLRRRSGPAQSSLAATGCTSSTRPASAATRASALRRLRGRRRRAVRTATQPRRRVRDPRPVASFPGLREILPDRRTAHRPAHLRQRDTRQRRARRAPAAQRIRASGARAVYIHGIIHTDIRRLRAALGPDVALIFSTRHFRSRSCSTVSARPRGVST